MRSPARLPYLQATSPSISEGAVQGLPSYAYLVTLMAGFSVIAFDVNAEDSLHLLQPLDTLVHTTVAQNIPFDFRANIADKLISDTPIHTGAAMVVGGLAVIATTRPKQAAALAGLYSIFNFSCAFPAPLTTHSRRSCQQQRFFVYVCCGTKTISQVRDTALTMPMDRSALVCRTGHAST